ncbi:MAG: hypothetical protein [Siphoviridae sp. ctCJE6]|nr:MAG: hypothetical protein [Siphoviridae sp. ctCJE6]
MFDMIELCKIHDFTANLRFPIGMLRIRMSLMLYVHMLFGRKCRESVNGEVKCM